MCLCFLGHFLGHLHVRREHCFLQFLLIYIYKTLIFCESIKDWRYSTGRVS